MTDGDIQDVVEKMRRSQYTELAEVIEHFVDNDEGQYGPVYKPLDAPHRDRIDVYHVLWAFRAGRAYEREQPQTSRPVDIGTCDEHGEVLVDARTDNCIICESEEIDG